MLSGGTTAELEELTLEEVIVGSLVSCEQLGDSSALGRLSAGWSIPGIRSRFTFGTRRLDVARAFVRAYCNLSRSRIGTGQFSMLGFKGAPLSLFTLFVFWRTILPLLGPTGAFEERLLSDVEDVTEVVRLFASRLFSSLQRGRRPSTLTSFSPPRPSFSFLAFSFTFSPFSLHTEEHLLHNTWSYHIFLFFL